MRFCHVVLSWALWALVPGVALADPFDSAVFEETESAAPARDAAGAEMLFQKGRDAMAESDFDAACQFFTESLVLDTAVGTVMNLAVCEEERGHYTAAWERWHQALRLLSPGDDRVIFADQKLESVAEKLAYLTVRLPPGAPPGLTVQRDGVPLGTGSLGEELPADPGEHVVTVQSPHHQTRTFRISLESGDHETLVVMQGTPKKKQTEKHTGVQARRIGGYAALGVGAAGGVMALVSGVLLPAHDQKVEDNCPEKQCNETGDQAVAQARTLLALNTAGIIIAGIGAATGTVLLLTLPKKPNSPAGPQKERAQRPAGAKEQRAVRGTPLALGCSAAGLHLSGQF